MASPAKHVNSLERGSAWLRLFHYVDKMAAVEYAKCTPLRTQRFGHFEYTYGSFQVHFFCRDHNRNTLRTQIKYTKYGKYGYRNTAQELCFDDARFAAYCDWSAVKKAPDVRHFFSDS